MNASTHAADPDVLSAVLSLMQLRGRVFSRCEFAAPWGIAFPPESAHFHVVERGECWVHPEDKTPPLRLAAGDLVVLPRGTGHRLGSGSRVKFVPIAELVRKHHEEGGAVLQYGGSGSHTQVVCGVFTFGPHAGSSLLASLPTMLHVPGQSARTFGWLDFSIRFLLTEASGLEPGSGLMTSRLVELILVQAIRHWITHAARNQTGWIAALRDPQVSAALAKLHAQPERGWTVPALAAEVSMSRAAFAVRFTSLVGESPLQYLTRWRMQLAARFLRTQRATVSQAASQVGYKSEAAFSRAFKRSTGIAPATYKREPEGHLSP